MKNNLQSDNHKTYLTELSGFSELNVNLNDNICPDEFRIIRGRLLTLNNPIGRFDILGPRVQNLGRKLQEKNEIKNVNEIKEINVGRKVEKVNEMEEMKKINEIYDINYIHSGRELGEKVEKKVVRAEVDEKILKKEMEKQMRINEENRRNAILNVKFIEEKQKNNSPAFYQKKLFSFANNLLNGKNEKKVLESDVTFLPTTHTNDGCEILSSISAFNFPNGTFRGNVISQKNLLQLSDKHNVHFGVRDGSYFVGYIDRTYDNLGTYGTDSESGAQSGKKKLFYFILIFFIHFIFLDLITGHYHISFF